MFKNLSTKNKILIIATLITLLIAIPLTIMQSLKQQNTKQRASSDSYGFSVMLSPSSLTKNINEDMDVDIHLLNSQSKEISAVDINYGGYNANMFESVTFQPSGEFQEIINKTPRYVGISSLGSNKNGVDINLGTLKFAKNKEAGTVYFSLYNVRINVSGSNNAIVLENIGGKYTITDINPSPAAGNIYSTPISIPTLIPTAIPISLPTATPVPTGSSSDAGYSACVALCNRYNFAAADSETPFDVYTCIQGCSK